MQPFDERSFDGIVEAEIALMPDDLAEVVRRHQVRPFLTRRNWRYGPEKFDCWVVLADERSHTGIALCEDGVGSPENRWVILWLAEGEHLGQDSGWFTSLVDALRSSWIVSGRQ